MKKIRVAYDMSFCADLHAHENHVTGVGRVAENIAHHLAQSPRIELLMTGCHGGDFHPALTSARTRLYWKDRWEDRVPFLEAAQSRSGLFPSYASTLVAINAPLNGVTSRFRKFRRKGLNVFSRWDAGVTKLDDKADLFHSPFRALPEAGTFCGPAVLTVHDLIPLQEPPEAHNRKVLETTLALLDPQRCRVLCVSEYTRRELCATNGFPLEQTAVSPLAAETVFQPQTDPEKRRAFLRKFQIPDDPFFLSVSNPQPRKNIPFLIRCFQQFAANEPRHRLLLAGSRKLGWGHDAVDQQIEAVPAVKDRIHFLGAITDEELAVAYSHCAAFVFPSLQEGFGLPPLEAMQCGAPVICSNTTSLPEVTGEAALLLSPTDAEAYVGALQRLAADAALRQELSLKSLRRAENFSWSKTAQIVENTYLQAWQQGKK